MGMDRTVAVRLRLLNAEFMAATRAAGASVKHLGKEMDGAARQGKKGMSEISTGVGIAGVALLGMAGYAVKAAVAFEKQMSAVSAATGATGKDLDALKRSALEMGAATKFSATEAAQGQEALAKAGVSTKDILGGALKGALDLAASGNLSVADSAEVAASAMVTFGLKGSDVTHVADVLAAAAGKAQGEVSDMAAGFRQSSAIAAQLGFSIEETAGALAMFANAGITGSDAGTSWKQAMLMMVAPTGKAASLMQDLGISFFDANGSMKSFSQIAGILQSKLGGLSQEQQGAALKTIFGADAYRVAAIAMKEGAAGADEWIAKVNDAGFAADMAAKKMDNLAGDMETLKGSFETAMIGAGSGATGVLRALAKETTSTLNGFAGLPGPIQTTVTITVALTGAVLALGGAYGTLAPKMAASMAALRGMGGAGNMAANGLGRAGRLAGGLGAAFVGMQIVGAVAGAVNDTAVSVEKLADALDNLAMSGKSNGELVRNFGRDLDGLKRSANFFTGNGGASGMKNATALEDIFQLSNFSFSVSEAQRNLDNLDASLSAMMDSGNSTNAGTAFAEIARQTGITTDMLPKYKAALDAAAGAGGPAADSAQRVAEVTGSVAKTAEDATAQLKEYQGALEGITGVASVDQATIAYQRSLKDLTAAVTENRGALNGQRTDFDLTGEKGQKLAEAFIAMSGKARDLTSQMSAMGPEGIADADAALAGMRSQMVQAAMAAGMSRHAANMLATAYGLLPSPAGEAAASAAKVARTTGIAGMNVLQLNAEIRRLKGKEIRVAVQGPLVQQTAQVIALRRQIEALRSRRIDIVMNTTRMTTGPRAGKPMPNMADGGIVVRKAADGYLPQQAMVATPSMGTLYQWNEPETAGEAFIPLATSKRGRSKSIAEDVVGMFGGTVAWAAGGMTASRVATSASGGRVTAELHPADRALLRAVADRPIQVRAELRTTNKTLAHAVAEGQRDIDRQG
jgi:TP901 family phage tail tape measure protein